MAIGRADVRRTQRGHTASQGRYGVWAPDAEPIWASGNVPRQQAGNTTTIAPVARFLQKPLASRGPSKHVTPVRRRCYGKAKAM